LTESSIELRYSGKVEAAKVFAQAETASLSLVERVGLNTTADGWHNLLIFGDNLRVLKALYKDDAVRGKVRLIYIDPPFATGREFNGNGKHEAEVAYQDFAVGPEFLDFLRQRLILLRELLADDGSIYVHIDWKMGHYVKVLMDEVFGQERFINDIARVKCNPKNFARKGYGNIKDMVLFYSKGANYVWNESWETMTQAEIERLFPKVDKDGRCYTTTPLHAPGPTVNGATGKPWRDQKPPKGRHWRYVPDELDRLDKAGLIQWSSRKNPRLKIFADEPHKKDMGNGGERRKKRQDIWEFKDPPYPVYPTEKNQDLLMTIIESSSNKDDLILDGFCGSGTTLIAAGRLRRRWIGIDSSPMAIEVAKRRLRESRTSSFDICKAT
jgi:adenine-specific DNA-methyltransferase